MAVRAARAAWVLVAGLAGSATLAAPPASTPHPAHPAPASPAAVAPAADKPTWKDLTAAQKAALAPLAGEWDRMDAGRKQKWLDIGNRFAGMKPDEQQRVHERMREWLKLTPEQRRQARENYTLAKKIDKSSKSAKWDEYQQLPEEEKKKLAAAAAAKKPQVTNLPPKAQQDTRTVKPVRPGAAAAAAAPAAAAPAAPSAPMSAAPAAPAPAAPADVK